MKKFNMRPSESGDQFSNRIYRYVTDKIIEDIERISSYEPTQIEIILRQLDVEALEIIVEDCLKLEKFEICTIAQNLITEKRKP